MISINKQDIPPHLLKYFRPRTTLKPGDRCGIPERFSLAMQAAGWCWRDTIIWAKRSPMPMSRSGWRWMRCRVKVEKGVESGETKQGEHPNRQVAGFNERYNGAGAKYRDCPGCEKCLPNDGWILRKGRFCTTAAHEPILMFVKGKEYFCDSEAASEPALNTCTGRTAGAKSREVESTNLAKGWAAGLVPKETRLPRSVWLLSNEPQKERHFAAYPTQIPKRLIEMATSQGGCCAECGTPWAPMVESERVPTRPGVDSKVYLEPPVDPESPVRAHAGDLCGNRDPQRHVARTKVLGYRAACDCGADSVPCRVLDPFLGTGTTARVARHLGREWCGIEASADYLPIAERNIARPLVKKAKANGKPPMPNQPVLF